MEIKQAIQFMKDHLIECSEGENCGRCNGAREIIKLLEDLKQQKQVMTPSQIRYDKAIKHIRNTGLIADTYRSKLYRTQILNAIHIAAFGEKEEKL